MLRYIPTYAGALSEEELEERARRLQATLGVSFIAARFLCIRGMDEETAHAFLHHKFDDLFDPFLLPDMEGAVDRIRKACARGERITVFGDYDADGVCATALLLRAMRENGFDASYYLPSRRSEGYGLNRQAMDTLAKDGTELVITVDCGITAIEEAAYARALGLDMIITDHHQPLDALPKAIACVAATRPDSRYPFSGLCGTGVAAKLVQALFGKEALKAHCDIAGLATVADLVPLLGENRILVKEGLHAMHERPLAGIAALCACAKVPPAALKAYHLGFVLGPRINAAGRLGDAGMAAELLLTDDEAVAGGLAEKLERDNDERRRLEQEILQQVLEKLNDVNMAGVRAIVAEGEGWDHGVIGIVASRLVEMLCMPVILFAREGDVLKGSGRSVPGVHLFNALKDFAHLFDKFGGHAQAAGVTMHISRFEAFAKGFEEQVRTRYDDALFMPVMHYDLEMNADDVSDDLARELESFEPYGTGNPMPVLRMEVMGAQDVRTMGADNRHIRFRIPSSKRRLNCVAFGTGAMNAELGTETGFEMLFTPQMNRWNGKEQLQCLVRHINLEAVMASPKTYIHLLSTNFSDAIIRQILYNSTVKYLYPNQGMETEEELEKLLLKRLGERTRGTLILCNTPAGALYTLGLLGKMRLLDRIRVRRNTLGNDKSAFNTLLLAPFDPPASCRTFDQAVVMDALPFPSSVPPNTAWYRAGVTGESVGFVEQTVLNRQELLMVFAHLKRMLRKPMIASGLTGLANTIRADGHSPAQITLALKIFIELGLLLEQKASEGNLYEINTGAGRTNLNRSESYNRIQAYVSLLKDMVK